MPSSKTRDADDTYSPAESERRRDEVIRRMANTPPQHRAKSDHPRKKAKATAARRKAHAGGSASSKSERT